MCRLTIYKGRPMLIGSIVIEPENSLLYQSRDAAYHPGVIDKSNVRNILVNGDGFGISWYGDDPLKGSCCFKFVTPAWSDQNLRNIGRHVSSPLIFAHVRAAASGHDPFAPMIVSNENCHPFTYKEYTFMHNGGIPSFQSIKLQLLNLLSADTFANIKGTTDTEHIFALFLNCLPPKESDCCLHTVNDMVTAVNRAISIILQLCAESGIKEHCSLNLCVTNGVHIIATRFRSGPKSPPSLYYNFGSKFVCRNGAFYAEMTDTEASEIVISSAPLSKVTCVEEQIMEIEHDLSFNEEDDRTVPMSPGSGLRRSTSGTSLRAMLQDDEDERSLKQQLRSTNDDDMRNKACDTDSDVGEDIGAWILIPKNHMLVCRGDELAANKVEAIYLERVVVKTSSAPLSKPLHATAYKRKVPSDAWEGVHFDHLQTQALASPVKSAKKACISDSLERKNVTVTYQQSEDVFSGTACISATVLSATSAEKSETAVPCLSADGVIRAAATVGCTLAAAVDGHNDNMKCSDAAAIEGDGYSIVSSPSTSNRQKPKCIKFTCKM